VSIPILSPHDTPRARRNDVISSHEAADATTHLRLESHRLVERILTDAGRSLTALEVESAAMFQYGWEHSAVRIRTALTELEGVVTVRDGFIRRPGDTRRRQLWTLIHT